MQKFYIVLLVFFTLLPLHSRAEVVDMQDPVQITVLAASSISEPLTEIARIYSKRANIVVTASFDGTSEQAHKIEQGEQADIFISAHPLWMSVLKQKGLIDVYSLTNIVRNKLSLVAASKSNLSYANVPGKNIADKINFLNSRKIMAMGDFDESALGLYTKQAIKNIDQRFGTSLFDRLKRRVIPSISAKNCLYLISHGETAGIIYSSDAYDNEEINIIAEIDENLYDPIIYQAAVVAGENMSVARGFLDFLKSPQALDIYTRYGFIPISPKGL